MTKVVINSCYGGFGLSDDAIRRYLDLKGVTFIERESDYPSLIGVEFLTKDANGKEEYFSAYDINRTDSILVQVVEEMGKNASGDFANLTIVDLPIGTRYRITEYDGFEGIETADDIDWEYA